MKMHSLPQASLTRSRIGRCIIPTDTRRRSSSLAAVAVISPPDVSVSKNRFTTKLGSEVGPEPTCMIAWTEAWVGKMTWDRQDEGIDSAHYVEYDSAGVCVGETWDQQHLC